MFPLRHTAIHTYIRWIHAYRNTYIHTCIQQCILFENYIHTGICSNMNAGQCRCCIHTYIHTYTHTCIHTYIDTCIHCSVAAASQPRAHMYITLRRQPHGPIAVVHPRAPVEHHVNDPGIVDRGVVWSGTSLVRPHVLDQADPAK